MEQSLLVRVLRLSSRRGDYGFDAPIVPFSLGAVGAILLALGILGLWVFSVVIIGVVALCCGFVFLLSAISYVYTTRRGKFRLWAALLLKIGIEGGENIVDIGCGRGAVLLMAASLLTSGKAVGVDLWRGIDQSGNSEAVTKHNARLEGVDGRVELHTADMRELPFRDSSFDIAVSSLAIHNIPSTAGRAQAIAEAVRVLKPGGELVVVDFRGVSPNYTQTLQRLGMTGIEIRSLGWRFWYGGPWAASILVTAHKPGPLPAG
jgi:arsenite methyltransferase